MQGILKDSLFGGKTAEELKLETDVEFPARVELAALGASQQPQATTRRELGAAAGAAINVLVGPGPRDGIVATHAHFPHFLHELRGVTVGLAPDPKPVMNHFMGHRIGDQRFRGGLFEQVGGHFDRGLAELGEPATPRKKPSSA